MRVATCGNALDPLLRRPFSIHRCPGGDQLHMLFRVVGRGTRLLAGIHPGEQLNLIGPLGQGFRLKPAEQTSVCLIGGGIGIAPLLFLAERIQALQGEKQPCTVLLGARTSAELLPLVPDFTALGCQVELATDDGTAGHHGLVLDLLTPHLQRTRTPMRVATCGPHRMIKAVACLCAEADISCEVSLESAMACGLGACLGCAIPGSNASTGQYKHICKHGPVFDANEVIWKR
jgi:dihydroorotate dehydrogenase electron transfer subunit